MMQAHPDVFPRNVNKSMDLSCDRFHEENHSGMMYTFQYQAVIDPKQGVMNQIIRTPINSGQCRWLSGTFNNPFDFSNIQVPGWRISPWINSTPASRNRARFSSEPRLFRLSNVTSFFSGNACLSLNAKLDPTKPAPPVISIIKFPLPLSQTY